MLSMELKGSDIARLLNISSAAITQKANEGKLIKNINGKYDIENNVNSNFLTSHGISKIKIEELQLIKIKKSSDQKAIKNTKNKDTSEQEAKKEEIKQKEAGAVDIISKEKDIEKDIEEENFSDRIEFENITGLPAKLMKLNLKQLVSRYGGPMMLKTWADILNKIMNSNEKDQRIQERRQELIDKDFVISRLFSYLETLNNQFFDFPAGAVYNIIALILSSITKSIDKKIADKILKTLKSENIEKKIEEDMKKGIATLIQEAKRNIDRELQQMKRRHIDNTTEQEEEDKKEQPGRPAARKVILYASHRHNKNIKIIIADF